MSEWLYLTLFILSVGGLSFVLWAQDRYWGNKVSELEENRRYERQEWYEERKQLLDRIQAPTFQDYKQAEIRMAKVEKGEPPKQAIHLE
ncbi:hypothetical protein ACFLFF_26945 [Brevibacillus reuszeri]|uniref:hypothetical protein n=1 Tax=Brevibacillus reuszeri TaxID=54915 RepID=UPI00366D7A2C